MRHPLTKLTVRQRGAAFWLFASLAVAVMIALQVVNAPLQTSAAPQGIISFELAGSTATVQAILDSWDAAARLHAAFGLGLDYLFMPLYGTAIALGCLWAADVFRQRGGRLAAAGVALAWGLGIAILCDAVENVALWRLLAGPVADPWPGIAFWCAAVKFTLVLFGLIYVVLGLGWRLLRPRPERRWTPAK